MLLCIAPEATLRNGFRRVEEHEKFEAHPITSNHLIQR